MNRIATFYLLALFCPSFTLAQANPERFCNIKEASVIDYAVENDSHTFDQGNAYLYATVDAKGDVLFYQIGDDSSTKSPGFLINQHRVSVTEDAISIRYSTLTITFMTVDEDIFAFYRRLFPFENVFREFSITGTFEETKKLDKICAIKKVELGRSREWIFMVLEGDTPRSIFPAYRTCPVTDECFDMKMTLILEANRKIRITMEFGNYDDTDAFHELI